MLPSNFEITTESFDLIFILSALVLLLHFTNDYSSGKELVEKVLDDQDWQCTDEDLHEN